MKKKIVILGAGLCGLSCAYHLNSDCEIYEKEEKTPQTTGAKSLLWGIGPDGHLLHFKSNYVKNLVLKLLKQNIKPHKRNSWIYSYSSYSRYPFQANLHGLPPEVIKECLLELVKSSKNLNLTGNKLNYISNFKEWIIAKFGEGIGKCFMTPYNCKFWTIPPEKLTCEWIDGFIPVPSLEQILTGTIEDSGELLGYNATFWYPEKGGIEEVALVLSKETKGKIHLSREAVRIDLRKKELKFKTGDKEKFNTIISTIPLPDLIKIIKPLPGEIRNKTKKLKFTSIFLLNLAINIDNISDKHWIYFPEDKFIFFRVGFPRNFSNFNTPRGYSSIYVEVAYSKYKPIDKSSIKKRIISDLIRAKIIPGQSVIEFEHPMDIKYGYVIYDKHYNETRRSILKFLEKNSIYSIGRFGGWRYMSMEDVILDGKKTAEKINNLA